VRRWLLLVLSVGLGVWLFAPVAAAKGDDGGFDDRGMHARGSDDKGFDDKGMHVRGVDDNALASPPPAPRLPRTLPLRLARARRLPQARVPRPLRPLRHLPHPCYRTPAASLRRGPSGLWR